MLKALFLHGGPGLTSEAERRRLASRLLAAGFDFNFWNEPSKNRPDGHIFQKDRALSGWLESIETVVREKGPFDLLVGSSFGALASLHLIARYPLSFARVAMISPTLDLHGTFQKMMAMAARDFSSAQPEVAAEIRALSAQSASFFDAPTQQGLSLVYQDPLLFGHYWVSSEVMGEWASVLGESRFGFDFESQNAVLGELARTPLPAPCQRGSRLMLMLGAHDPVRDDEKNMRIVRPWFDQIDQHVFARSGHFPHFEEADEFASQLKAFCAKA